MERETYGFKNSDDYAGEKTDDNSVVSSRRGEERTQYKEPNIRNCHVKNM